MRSAITPLLALALASCSGATTVATSTPPATATVVPTVTPTATPAATVLASPSRSPSPSPAAVAAIRYVAIGASDTVGVGATDPPRGSWPALLAARLPAGTSYTNLGVSGSLAAQAKAQQLPAALAARPTLVTIWLAVNDFNGQVDAATYGETIRAILEPLAATEASIFIANVPDLRAVPVYAALDPAVVLSRVNAYNEAIRAAAARFPERVTVVDLFTGSASLMTTATVSSDGFHPSDAGYVLVADRFAAAMRARGVPLR